MSGDWRSRIIEAVERSVTEDGRSYRDISIRAGVGQNFVGELVRGDKRSNVENVIKVAQELGLSLAYVFAGVDIKPEDEAFLRILGSMSQEEKNHLLGFLRSKALA